MHLTQTVLRRSQARRTARRHMIGAIAALTLAFAIAAPAQAAAYSRESYTWTDAWTYDDCGPTVDATVEGSGRISLRTGTGPDDGAFFAHDRFSSREVHVRRSDGKTAIVDVSLLYEETSARRVAGSIFEFSSIMAGTVTVRTADGRVVIRDRGVLRETILFDTEGDDVPGGELVALVDRSFHGKFPGLSTDAFCDFWNE